MRWMKDLMFKIIEGKNGATNTEENIGVYNLRGRKEPLEQEVKTYNVNQKGKKSTTLNSKTNRSSG